MTHPTRHASTHFLQRTLLALLVAGLSLSAQPVLAAALKLTGEQEVPPVITSGNGTGEFTVAADGAISGNIATHGVQGTTAHIHAGAIGVNGPVIITLTRGDGGVWKVPPGARLTTEQLALYRSGGLYVNVHTDGHKGGEIRAQLSN
jgi:CHRD domain